MIKVVLRGGPFDGETREIRDRSNEIPTFSDRLDVEEREWRRALKESGAPYTTATYVRSGEYVGDAVVLQYVEAPNDPAE